MEVGDKVEKVSGYRFPGVIVAKFFKLNNDVRYVVECIAPSASGMLHIFSGKQLKKYEEKVDD